MGIQSYYETLIGYRENLNMKVHKGKLDLIKFHILTDKLNEWYEEAKRLDKLAKQQKLKKTKKE